MWIEKKGMVQWYRVFNRNKETMIRILNLYVAGEKRAEISPLIPLAKNLPNGPLRKQVKKHLADEGRHAKLLINRIRQLGGQEMDIPKELEPQEFFFKKEGNLKAWLDQGEDAVLSRERVIEVLLFNAVLEAAGATGFFAHAEATRDDDPETYFLLMQLLPDEIRHSVYTMEYAYRLAGRDMLDFARQTHKRFHDMQAKYWATVMRLMLEHLIPRSVTGMSRVEYSTWMAIAKRQERRGVTPIEVFPMPKAELLVTMAPPYGMDPKSREIEMLIEALDNQQRPMDAVA